MGKIRPCFSYLQRRADNKSDCGKDSTHRRPVTGFVQRQIEPGRCCVTRFARESDLQGHPLGGSELRLRGLIACDHGNFAQAARWLNVVSVPAQDIEDEGIAKVGEFLSDSGQLVRVVPAALITDVDEIQPPKNQLVTSMARWMNCAVR